MQLKINLNKLSRRNFLKFPLGLFISSISSKVFAKQLKPFSSEFKVPKLALGKRDGKNLYFDLTIKKGLSKILPIDGWITPTYGINQNFLGNTLRANKGDIVHIKVNNNINEDTTLHWHGMKLPAKQDGGPHQIIKPKSTWLSEFEIIQEASTLWYHSHKLHKTGEQVYKGLAGLFIIDDKKSQTLNLPSEYGVDDFPVIIQDRDFNEDGTFRYVRSGHEIMAGKHGDVILTNGIYKPLLKITKPLIRLRLLNGSNARVYNLNFNDKRDFYVIASDGGLLEKSIKTKEITLSPGERAEILVDLSDLKQITLQYNIRSRSGESIFAIFKIDGRNIKKSKVNIPHNLVNHAEIPISKVINKRTMKLQMGMGTFGINNKMMDISRIDEVVKANSVEVWTITNNSMMRMAHPFHIHNVQFKILSKTYGIKNHEVGFKDTVLVNSNEIVKIIIQFPHYKDDKTPYMYHCHILEHEDRGMMGQFTIV